MVNHLMESRLLPSVLNKGRRVSEYDPHTEQEFFLFFDLQINDLRIKMFDKQLSLFLNLFFLMYTSLAFR